MCGKEGGAGGMVVHWHLSVARAIKALITVLSDTVNGMHACAAVSIGIRRLELALIVA